ncbi:alkyl/aryl-sulfatase [Flexibacterium corallicola]|uniref:alkyl/aryl-sulfatase n=1 Tax=Flexibacterium corallicola TaxID=3037259 RepID=UPI00286FA2A1|nr:alkyl sulfatase dimerization domain-containing protein [Pseudovibrio sp. M1P-2-3]
MKQAFFRICALTLVVFPCLVSQAIAQPKPASKFTQRAYEELIQTLPFSNTQSFVEAMNGFIAPLPHEGVVKNDKGQVVYDFKKFSFIKQGSIAPTSVNPSLWRQAQLIMMGGLFKVSDRIYQVRAADLSNITFIEGDTGIIVVDPLISKETAKYALDFYFTQRPKKPVVAVIYTHSHVDHYGGVRGVIDEQDVVDGLTKIYAPSGFLNSAVSENVMAGNAMSRRASYMYGNLLYPGPEGQVGAGLGPTTSSGTITLIPPTNTIKQDEEQITIDGLSFRFFLTPDSEAPSEMMFYIDELEALCMAENATHTLHNTYSLRGARIRDSLAWSKYINQAIHSVGKKTKVLFAPHHWSITDTPNILKHLTSQRDLYRFINDQPLRLANHGFHMTEIAEMLKMPKGLEETWSARGYYGSVNHNAKSTYVKYLGWFNGNPATLHNYPERVAGGKYVEFMGGEDELIKKAQYSFKEGDYRWVVQVLNHLVYSNPQNTQAKNLQADALEQLGYQAESGPWRNFYLTGAQELRDGVKKAEAPDTASPDTIRSMGLDLVFDYFALRVNADKVTGLNLTYNWKFTDTNQNYVMELSNSALSHLEEAQSDKPDGTITTTRTIIDDILLGEITFSDALSQKKIVIDGSEEGLLQLIDSLDTFDFWFNIVTPVPMPAK